MAQSSEYHADAIQQALLGLSSNWGTLSPGPAATYIALCTVTVTPGMTGSTITECTYAEYTRISVPKATGWVRVSVGRFENVAAVQFPKSLGVTAENVVSFAVVDAVSAGNMICFGTASLAISQGIQPEFAIGDLDLIQS